MDELPGCRKRKNDLLESDENDDFEEACSSQAKRKHSVVPAEETSFSLILHFPDSLILDIFRYLNFKELCKVAEVCRQWYRLSHDPVLRKSIDASSFKLTVSGLSQFIDSHLTQHVQELSLKGALDSGGARCQPDEEINLTSEVVSSIKAKCPDLRLLHITEIIFKNCRGQSPTTKDLPSSLQNLSLRKVLINFSLFFNSTPEKDLPQLQSLDFGFSLMLLNRDLLCISNWKSLRALGFEGVHFIDMEGIRNLEPIFPKLEVIDIEGTCISDEGIEDLLKLCVELKSLFLASTHFTGSCFRSFGKANRLSLRTLCVRKTNILEENFLKLGEIAPGLRTVIAADTTVTSRTVAEFKKKVPLCKVDRCPQRKGTCNHFASARWHFET